MRRSSLIPDKDPTLLFTNAGMVQFKNVFLGMERRSNSRATSAQPCLRLSGKHNDLDAVGRDTFHHTLFEMLGNWSFGDYYKKEAIASAWELLTDVWKLPKPALWATVFRTDDEAALQWQRETDIDPSHILRFDEADNFWEMGETGPCGPCSEIHIDRGATACDRSHVPGHVCGVNVGCARFIELWNLVFIQYNRTPDGGLHELAAKHVDTGMGLERTAAVLQGVLSNYDTDLLRTLISFTERAAGRRYGDHAEQDVAFRVLADHSRALAFMIADGVVPANDGRGYVLRRLLRRAARHATVLGFDEPYLWRMTEPVIAVMGGAYPELVERRTHIEEVIRAEEERFAETLEKGLAVLEQERRELKRRGATVLAGDVAFRLYDTYGFPLDMTEDILRNEGIRVDVDGFHESMEAQRQRARDARKGPALHTIGAGSRSRFVGDRVYEWDSEISAIGIEGEERREARQDEEVQIVTPETPFYGESGGQVGDRGVIELEDGSLVEIVDTQKPQADLTVHLGRVQRGVVQLGARAHLRIDGERRDATRLNHSATHILHAVLRRVLGSHVRQAGSLVAPDRLRFDFSHTGAVDPATLERIEEAVNAHIRENAEVHTTEMRYDDAIKAGALAFFGEKYGERVSVLRMGDFSTELCGGTHVQRTGDIGVLRLRGESSVAAGVRRVEAVTGAGALEWMRGREHALRQAGELLSVPEEELAARLEKLLAQQRELERQLAQLQRRLSGNQTDALLAQAQPANGIAVIAAKVADADPNSLRQMADQLRDRLGSGVVVLASGAEGGGVNMVAAVTKDLVSRHHAGKLIGQIAPIVGGKGGGRPDFAQAGGKDSSKIDDALARARELLAAGN